MSRPLREGLFVALMAIVCFPFVGAPIALLAGLVVGLTLGNPFAARSKKVSGQLLRACVVLLGFSMNLDVVLRAGLYGLGMAAVTILTTLALGAALGRLLAIPWRTSALISSGTAICGGSAIAAVGSVIEAEQEEMTVAIGTVFLLNAAALFVFPPLGHALGMSGPTFGEWAGIAIHDISSVVGAATAYGQNSLETATAIKLSRTLWIAPLALGAGWWARRHREEKSEASRAPIPWFILWFLVASLLGTKVPVIQAAAPVFQMLAKSGLALTLFLIGSSVSLPMLQRVGWRPILQGVLLWIFIAVTSAWLLLRLA